MTGYKGAAQPSFKIFVPLLKTSLGPDGRKRLHGVASSSIKDRHGDTITNSALIDMERSASENMTIFLNHEYRVPEDVAGSVERALIRSHPQDPEVRDLVLDIVVNESNERAVKAWEAIESGTKLGLSIGALIPEGGATRDRKSGSYTIDHVELLETSLVGVPANPRSWVEYAIKMLNTSWADPDAPEGPGVRSDGEEGIVVETTEADASGELAAEELEHTDDPPDLEEGMTAESEPELCEECGEAIDACKCNNRRRRKAEATTTSNSASWTFTQPADITDATVNIETPYANISIDTGNRGPKPASDGSSQEALASAPETEDQDEEAAPDPWAGILPTKSEDGVSDLAAALQMLEPTVVASMRSSTELLAAITRELIDTKAALEQRNADYAALEAMTKQVVTNTAQILDRLSNTPAGRRAVVRQVTDDFGSLAAVYGEDFLRLLKRS